MSIKKRSRSSVSFKKESMLDPISSEILQEQLAAATQGWNQMFSALETQREQFQETLRSIAEIADRAARAWKRESASIAKSAEANSGIDWKAVWERQKSAAVIVGASGWTIVGWLTLPELSELATKSRDELDAYFSDAFMADDARSLRELRIQLLESEALSRWRKLLEEVFAAILQGKYRVAVPATLTIIEGFANSILVSQAFATVSDTNPHTALKKAKWGTGDHAANLYAISASAFLQQLFAHSPFIAAEPELPNRHWILHGRSSGDWALADALRLVNALNALDWVAKMQKP